LLAIPYIGTAIEKAIFGPLDEKAKDEARRQINDALDELRTNVRFVQADLKDQIALLAEYVRVTSSELAEKIENLSPVQIEQLIVQNIRPIIVNVSIKMSPEEVRSLSNSAGMLPIEIPPEETPDRIGALLFDTALEKGNLSEFIEKLADNNPSLLEQFRERPSNSTLQDLKAKLADASSSLLKWPTTLGNEIWLNRGELDLLEERLRNKEGTANLILGKPGTGKSAILALLSQRLINKGVPVLAIKADMLPGSIKDFDDLQTHLHLPAPVMECLSVKGVIPIF